MIKRFIWILAIPLCGFAFEQSPWVDSPYLFRFRPSLEVSYFPGVNGGSPSSFSSLNEDLNLNLGVATMSRYEIQLETDFFHSKMRSFNFESVALQLRNQFMDDIAGAPISLTLGGSYRFVPMHRLHDVAMPYHYLHNFELVSSIGKEWSSPPNWIVRSYGLLAVGIANQGSPWIKANLLIEGAIAKRHEIAAIVESYFGFGFKNQIDIDTFSGYYNVAHRSIDVGLRYAYEFDIYGTLSAKASYRVYAHAYPENLVSILLEYSFPFSLF